MAMGKKIQDTITNWGVVAIIIVVVSVVLLKFKDVSAVTSALNTTIDTFVTAFSEPKNFIVIVIIGVIGFGLISLFRKKA